jgi:hypothetical protein
MSTDRLHPELLRSNPVPALEAETAADTPIFLPLEFDLDPPVTPGADDSWLEVIRYWVDELRWWRKHWGGSPH